MNHKLPGYPALYKSCIRSIGKKFHLLYCRNFFVVFDFHQIADGLQEAGRGNKRCISKNPNE